MQMSKSPSRRFSVIVTRLPVTRCQVCYRTVAYRTGSLSEVLTGHYRRAHPRKRSASLPSSLRRLPALPIAGQLVREGTAAVLPAVALRARGEMDSAVSVHQPAAGPHVLSAVRPSELRRPLRGPRLGLLGQVALHDRGRVMRPAPRFQLLLDLGQPHLHGSVLCAARPLLRGLQGRLAGEDGRAQRGLARALAPAQDPHVSPPLPAAGPRAGCTRSRTRHGRGSWPPALPVPNRNP